MVASAANGFGQIRFQPGGRSCMEVPYTFHPMYSTSGQAHGYNVVFSDEIGHFDFCTTVDTSTGACTGKEGIPSDQGPARRVFVFCDGPGSGNKLTCFVVDMGRQRERAVRHDKRVVSRMVAAW
jgi:hypothetical protein